MYHYLVSIKVGDTEEQFDHYNMNDICAKVYCVDLAFLKGGHVTRLFNTDTHTNAMNAMI